MNTESPALVVFSSLFPSEQEPLAGVFIRERMFRVGRELPLTVVSPQPWFPLQSLIGRWRPGYRARKAPRESMRGVEVLRPRFFSVPGVLRRLDGLSMALACWWTLRRLQAQGRADIIDAHFAYPDGYAAALLGRWFDVPVTITLRGTEPRHARDPVLGRHVRCALRAASRVFTVSGTLRTLALELGTAEGRPLVVGNGVDLQNFTPVDRIVARRSLGLPQGAKVLVTVGGLVERKGFHRVIDCLPSLLRTCGDVRYLIVGGPSPEGDWRERLRRQASDLGLQARVHFLGPVEPKELRVPLSAADLFVLATSNEGWANVLLEAMACGLPVVTTDVGGNTEVVCRSELGIVVPFGDQSALVEAIEMALQRHWDAAAIRAYARTNQWDSRVAALVAEFRRLAREKSVRGTARRAVADG
jgi:glycosyltransferase involved in cell wall biosynthesis